MKERDQRYIDKVRRDTQSLWTAINNLVEHQKQWNALDYGNTLEDGEVTKADVGAAVFATTDAIMALLNSGHATNLAKLL